MSIKVGLRFIEKWGESLENQVLRYEAEDAPTGQIVFYGPSDFTRWSSNYGIKPLREVLLGKSGQPCAINRGFGSSCAEHQLYYYPRMVRPLAPSVLVYATMGNMASFGYTPEETWELEERVLTYTRTDFPDCKLFVLGSNPRRTNTKERLEAVSAHNALARKFAEKMPNCVFDDPYEYAPFRDETIFLNDGVHFNQRGYDLYAEYFRELLKEELARF
jgi:hypothetical protein